ncbi:MAG: ATP-binding cassette domain-containing protein [Planctomycetaceae bacterium]|jgi:ABC-type sugar transport system ATPase subunit
MIEVSKLSMQAGNCLLKDISFRVETGQYAILMGRTGIGKTTILEAVCGLRSISSGAVLINHQDVTNWSPGERNLGYMPQDLALFSTMSVRSNIEFALKIRRIPKAERAVKVEELAGLLQIHHLLDRSTVALSGGEAQRVALARALAATPAALLLDEPISALDRETRLETQQLLKTVNRRTGVTVLHITHDEAEAEALADVRLQLEQDREAKTVRIRSSAT